MKFKLTIDCDNAAFGDGWNETVDEVNRILRNLTHVVSVDPGYDHAVLDSNGNTVGRWSLK